MTQISRPFQIALAALVLFVAVWFVALRGHSSGGESSSSSSAPATGSSSSSAQSSAGPTAPGGGTPASQGGVYHGSAPGVEGLSRAIQKARGAVAQSQQSAKQLQQQSAQASDETQGAQSTSGHAQDGQSQSGGKHTGRQGQGSKHAQSQSSSAQSAPAAGSTGTASRVPAMQAAVESELKTNRTVIVLFWNPKGSVDVTVRHQLSLLQGFLKQTATLPRNRNVAVHYSLAAEVGRYGTITRSLQVYETPTMLVIAPHGSTKTLTGLVDAYTIRQAIQEARAAQP